MELLMDLPPLSFAASYRPCLQMQHWALHSWALSSWRNVNEDKQGHLERLVI